MDYGFGAMMARMSYINRWGLMRNSRAESLSEHSLATAVVAHLLACIANSEFGAGVDPAQVACCALYHDASEILTGDLPTPVKYANENIRGEYKSIEREAEQQLVEMLPPSIQTEAGAAITGARLSEREHKIIKAADKITALVKCIEEERNGNTEFMSAKTGTLAVLERSDLPEVAYYLEYFLPAYSKTLDELLARD